MKAYLHEGHVMRKWKITYLSGSVIKALITSDENAIANCFFCQGYISSPFTGESGYIVKIELVLEAEEVEDTTI